MKLMKSIWAFFGLFMLANCSNDPLAEVGLDSEEGQLFISSLQVSAEILEGDDNATRAAASFPTPPRPEELTLRIVVPGSNMVAYEKVGPLTAPVKLKTGEYVLECIYGQNKAGFTPYLYHKQNFRIAKGQTTNLTDVKVGLACAMVRAQVNEELWKQLGNNPLLTLTSGNESLPMKRNQECYVPAGKPFQLKLEGTDVLSQPWSYTHQRTEAETQAKYRYTLTFQMNQPAFQLPAQPEGNAWSKHIYITPVGDSDITADAGIRQKLLTEMQYEVTTDGKSWKAATKEGENWIIRGLTPSTTYTLRARYQHFTVSTNTQTLTTESADVLPNGELDQWTSAEVYNGNGTWSTTIYCDQCTGWTTNNEAATAGAKDASGASNYGLHWRWRSTSLPHDVAQRGKTAELVTTAFYNQEFMGSVKRKEILSKVQSDPVVYTGLLKKENVAHTARPVSISFDYAYTPVTGDHGIAYAKIYDASGNEIAVSEPFDINTQSNFVTQTLKLKYTDVRTKMATMTIHFESGSDKDANKMKQIEGKYKITPFVNDYVAGSILQLDHIVLNYE